MSGYVRLNAASTGKTSSNPKTDGELFRQDIFGETCPDSSASFSASEALLQTLSGKHLWPAYRS